MGQAFSYYKKGGTSMLTLRASIRVLTILGIVIIGLLVILLISNSSKAQSQQITRPVYEYIYTNSIYDVEFSQDSERR